MHARAKANLGSEISSHETFNRVATMTAAGGGNRRVGGGGRRVMLIQGRDDGVSPCWLPVYGSRGHHGPTTDRPTASV